MRALAALVLVAACSGLDKPATEILVTVDTTFGVPCTIDALHVDVTSAAGSASRDVALTGSDLPGSIALVPAGDGGDLTVTVTGLRGGVPYATAAGSAAFDAGNTLEMRFVLDPSCVPGPCSAIGVGGYQGLPPSQVRRGCGSAGYRLAPSVFAIRDACDMAPAAGSALVASTEQQEAQIPLSPLPFPFTFYGVPATSLWVGTSGYLAFSDAAPHALTADIGSPQGLDTAGFPAPAVLPFWDDLATSAHGVCYAVSGEAPDRLLWVTWKEACFAPDSGSSCGSAQDSTLTFTVALEETTDNVYFGYPTMLAANGRANALTATIGLTDTGARGCPATECGSDGACADGTPCGYTQLSAQHVVDPLVTQEAVPR